MTLTSETYIDKIENLEDGQIQVRKARVLYEHGKGISRTFHRHVIDPGRDVAKLPEEDARVRAVAEAVWTPEVVTAREAKLEETRTPDSRRLPAND